MTKEKSPEEWDAEDHITNMKTALLNPDLERDCPTPSTPKTLLQVLIWVVRRLDLRDKKDKKESKESKTYASFGKGLFVFEGFSAGDIMKLMILAIGIWGIFQWGKFKQDIKTEVRKAFIEVRTETTSINRTHNEKVVMK